MNKINQIILFTFLSLVLIPNIYAQNTLNLEQCITMAFERNLQLKSKEYNVQSTEIDIKQAKQARMPSLNGYSQFGVNLGRTIDPTSNSFSTSTFMSNSFGLTSDITIYNYNRINNTIKQAKLSKASIDKDYEQLKLDIALQVTSAYVNILFAMENIKNADLQMKLNESQLEQIDIFIRAGSKPETDRLDLLAAIALQEQTIITIQNQYDLAILSLKQLLKLDYNEDLNISLDNNFIVNTNISTLTIDDLVQKVIQQYPALQSASMQTEMAAMDISIRKAALYPSLTANFNLRTNYSNQGQRILSRDIVETKQNVTVNDVPVEIGFFNPVITFEDNPYIDQLNENLSYGAGISLNIPIYNRYQGKASVEKAKLALLQSQNNYDIVKNQLVRNLQQVLADARASMKELKAAERSYNSLQSAYANAEKKHEQGMISTFEYLQVKNQMDSAQLKMIISKYNYLFKGKILDYYLAK